MDAGSPCSCSTGAENGRRHEGNVDVSAIAIAHKPGEFPELLDRMGALMRRPYDWSEDVEKLEIPVMLVYGGQ
jgi:hypothetical protein